MIYILWSLLLPRKLIAALISPGIRWDDNIRWCGGDLQGSGQPRFPKHFKGEASAGDPLVKTFPIPSPWHLPLQRVEIHRFAFPSFYVARSESRCEWNWLQKRKNPCVSFKFLIKSSRYNSWETSTFLLIPLALSGDEKAESSAASTWLWEKSQWTPGSISPDFINLLDLCK